MTDEVQPGVKIDRGVWERFREDIMDRKGRIRGHLRTELEAAIQQYLDDNTDSELARIEAKVDHLAAELEADVSHITTPSRSEDTHTHAGPVPDEKPAANAATEKKVRWLAEQVIAEVAPNTREFPEIPRDTLREVVKEEYGFRRDTAKRYVSELVEHFDLRDHPVADGLLVTEQRRQEIIAARREQTADDADAELEDITNT